MKVSSQKVGANPCGRLYRQAQDLPVPQVIEKIRDEGRQSVKVYSVVSDLQEYGEN